jgi:hypothetical protein
MGKIYRMIIFICILIVPSTVSAASFDGSQPLLCTLMKAMECTSEDGCIEVTLESINVRQFLHLDFQNKSIQGTGEDRRQTKIENMEHIDGKLIIQGAEDGVEGVRDGVGWTAAIMKDTGKMIVTASGDQVGFVVFGACIRD